MNKSIITQINSAILYNMYFKEFLEIASNVWLINNLPNYLDITYINNILTSKGAIAFFYDEIIERIIALPFLNIGNKDMQNNPLKIRVFSDETGYNRTLTKDEFVIMYDNTLKLSLLPNIILYAKQYAIYTQIKNINIIQQKTPRIYKVPQEQEASFKKLFNDIDSNVEAVYTYENLEVDDLDVILKPADFVADKIQEQRKNLYNEFLEMIGITSLNIQKKERLIVDEVQTSQGGAIAKRYNRFTPRKQAIDLINFKFKDYLEKPLQLKYYDTIPTTEKKEEYERSENNEI